MEMTKRVFKGISGMILTLVAGLGTVDVSAQCTADILINQNPTTCFSQVIIEANASAPAQSYTYLLDGEVISNGQAFMVLDLPPGTYSAGVVVITNQGCTAIDDTVFTVNGNPLDVTINGGSDILACQEQPLLNATVTSVNPYSVQWTPANLLSNPTSLSPMVTENVFNQWFILDVIDNVSGCITSDTIMVTQQNALFDTLSLCTGPVEIDLGPGATAYNWLSFTDTAGNSANLNYPTAQQTIVADEPGGYFMYADFPECGTLTSTVTVEPCTSCSNFFTFNQIPQQCSETYFFVPGSSAQAVSYHWDFGDGNTSIDTQPQHVYTAGIYEVTLTITDVNQCVSASTQTVYCTIGHSVLMSNDTVGCQEEAYMEVFPTGGSGDYSYSWTPTQGVFSDPTQPVFYVEGVHDQVYYAYVTDNVTGCVRYDSVKVSSYEANTQTLDLCTGTALIDLGPGATAYHWLSFEDTLGNSSPLNYITTQQAINVQEPGTYFAYAEFPGCGALTSLVTVEACPSSCTSTITSGLSYQDCGAYIDLVGSYSTPIDSAVWDLGNGDVVFDNGSGIPTQFYTGGSYIVELTAYHTGGCVSTTSYGITLLTDIEAEINAVDTIACAGQLFLTASATGGGGQYTYYWPQSGNTIPSVVLAPTQNEWITVEVFDSYTGCSDSDSVYVYVNQTINETYEMCQPSVPLMVDPGSMIYNWSYTDQSGNTTSLPNATNELEATNLGTYNCMTYYSGCQQVVHTFEIIQCGTVCSSDFIAVPNPQQCGSLYDFAGQNFSHPVDSVVWDYGDGTTYTDGGGGEAHFFAGGAYTVTLTAYHLSGCISTSSQSFTVNSGVTIELIEDTLACNGSLFLNHTISGGSGGYIYEWFPQAAMSNPTAANPVMTVTTDEWVEVHLEDAQTGCWAVDSMYVYANAVINETLQFCDDSVLLAVNPGSQVYNWSYTDEFGNTTQLQNFENAIYTDEIGTYICFTYYSGCNTVTHSFMVEDCATQNDEVWPGDANSDGVVTNSDALYLGLAFNQTGPNRPAATLNWVGQPCPDWTFNFAVNNVNLKHADCDGNGIINFDDTLAIDFNYLNTHNKFEGVSSGGNPPIWVEVTPDTVGLEQAIDIVVHLGSVDQPVDSLHGVAFSLMFDESLFTQNGFTVDFDNCVLGTAGNDVLTFQKNLFNDGMLDVAVTRNTLENFQGYGPIIHARIVTTDNLSGVHDAAFGIGGVVAITASETPVELSSIPDTVVIDPNKVGIDERGLENLSIYPNPATDVLNITGLVGSGTVSVLNTMGQEALAVVFQNSDRIVLNLSELTSGVYLVQIRTANSITTRKLRLIRS